MEVGKKEGDGDERRGGGSENRGEGGRRGLSR